MEYPYAHRSADVVYVPTNIKPCEVAVFDDEGKETLQDGYAFDEWRISSPVGLPEEAVQALIDLIK